MCLSFIFKWTPVCMCVYGLEVANKHAQIYSRLLHKLHAFQDQWQQVNTRAGRHWYQHLCVHCESRWRVLCAHTQRALAPAVCVFRLCVEIRRWHITPHGPPVCVDTPHMYRKRVKHTRVPHPHVFEYQSAAPALRHTHVCAGRFSAVLRYRILRASRRAGSRARL
jgi:hypothetical protein